MRRLYEGTSGEGVQSTSFACSATQRFSKDPAHPRDATELTASAPVPLCSPTSAPAEQVRTRRIKTEPFTIKFESIF